MIGDPLNQNEKRRKGPIAGERCVMFPMSVLTCAEPEGQLCRH